MGRPSKLTDSQRSEAQRRLAGGESFLAVSRSMKIPKTTLVRNFSDQVPKLKTLAGALVSLETEMAALPLSDQVTVRNIADRIKGISANLAEAALVGSDTARALAVRANGKLKALDDADPEVATAALKTIGALHAIGNEASKTAMGLVSANKGKGGDSASTLEDLVTGRASSE